MATIGQVVYNLQDFHASGGLVSTSATNPSTTVSSLSDTYESDRMNIFTQDLVKDVFKVSNFTKLGIQAPPGTKVKLNSNKIIMIGRTGVYELDEDVKISGLQFERPKKYIIDSVATQESLNKGIQGLSDAEDFRKTNMTNLDAEYAGKDKDDAYWATYTRIQNDYQTMYNTAQAEYIAGVNGIYGLPSEILPDASPDDDYEELYNVIIDFLY